MAGLTTFHINTIAVGLELVALGGTKPAGMNIKWTTPKKPREAIEQTKHFALLALLVHVVEAFDGLLRDYSNLDWINLPVQLRGILCKSVTKPKNVQWAIHERAEELLKHLKLEMHDSIAFLELMVHWRHALVHASHAEARLSESASYQLLKDKQQIAVQYANIDIERTLENFKAGGWPTLKEATTMIAVTQNLAREIDRQLLMQYADSEFLVERIARRELGKALVEFKGGWKKILGRDDDAKTRVLIHFLNNAGIVETTESISAALPPSFVSDLGAKGKESFEQLVNIATESPSLASDV